MCQVGKPFSRAIAVIWLSVMILSSLPRSQSKDPWAADADSENPNEIPHEVPPRALPRTAARLGRCTYARLRTPSSARSEETMGREGRCVRSAAVPADWTDPARHETCLAMQGATNAGVSGGEGEAEGEGGGEGEGEGQQGEGEGTPCSGFLPGPSLGLDVPLCSGDLRRPPSCVPLRRDVTHQFACSN